MPEDFQLNQEVAGVLDAAREVDDVVVLVTGVFDILHDEHRLFLEKAKAAGDVLVVGLESDVRVRQLKGEGRPIHSEHQRLEQISQLESVDVVFVLPEQFSRPEDHKKLIYIIKPSVLAVSSHSPHLDKKRAILAEVGGEVRVVHQHNPEVSTTKLLEERKEIASRFSNLSTPGVS